MTYPAGVDFTVITALTFDFVGWIIHNVGLGTTHWSVLGPQTQGVVQYCYNSLCTYRSLRDMSSYQITVLFLAVAAITWSFSAMVLALHNIYKGYTFQSQTKTIPILGGALSIVACVFAVIEVIIWAAEIHRDFRMVNQNFELGYSFALTIVGACLYFLGGILFITSQRKKST
ncbi:unnamed protein product [Lymnaea stagnalis]|uniref:MARVEL domain-containing protein n=1 Tax=Lymnaea stagnalis TaxID=6523 RepID=A0AAV2I5Z4_LYMST